MKKFLCSLFVMLFSLTVFAAKSDEKAPVTLVSYDHSWLQSEATISLKNNTDEEIKKVSFRIIYFNMKGKQLDYRDFTVRENIDPGMTRETTIAGYGTDRRFSYYKSEAAYGQPHRYKIKFELKNVVNANDSLSADSVFDDSEGSGGVTFLLLLIGAFYLIVIGVAVGMFVATGVMAHKRHRSVFGWLFVAIFTTPIIAIILLLCLGDSYEDYYRPK